MSLSCQGLHFYYGQHHALKDISFEVKDACFCALLGRNGSGKTTLLHCMNGILKPSSGTLRLDGVDITRGSAREIARNVSMVPQERSEMFPFDVLDVVVMGRTPFLKMYESPSQLDYAMAKKALAMVGAEKLAPRNFNRISGGERQLALVARALVQDPSTLLLDEPTNHLDFKNQYLLLNQIKTLCRKRGTRVVTSMHDPNMATLFADRVILLKYGRIVAQGTVTDIMTEEHLSDLYETELKKIDIGTGRSVFLPASVTT
ncbi:MAG: ABC transporter ATP-binding protein [Desulfoplanes sp.]|nr:ABC transporter ATP-binding protein [Desulfoplanes sp.]MDD4650367.1 ABC transporter ATP-binding protein [Desulfoplanes sp.]